MAERTRTRDDARNNDTGQQNGFASFLEELPLDRLKDELQDALAVVTERATEVASDKVGDLTDRLVDVAANGGVTKRALAEGGKAAMSGGSPVMGALKGGVMGVVDKAKDAVTGGGGSGKKGKSKPPTKAVNIVEQIDVGVPVHVAYNQWTQFQDFSGFMKKVEKVEQKDDEKVEFKAKVLWSHRTWQATILEQVPDKLIVWHSEGEKGHVDGSVTFHELAPELTRILVDLVYYPQGLFERTGNIWRAQGRRARLELKHFRRHVMTEVIQHPDEVEGWRGEIHDAEVERTHEEALDDEDEYDDEDRPEDEYDEDEPDDEDESAEDEPDDEDESAEDEYDDESDDEYDEGEEGEEPEDEYEDAQDEEPEDEYDEDEEPEDEEPEDEYEDDEGEYDEDEEPEDEYDDEEADDEYDEDEDEYDDEPDERSHRRAS